MVDETLGQQAYFAEQEGKRLFFVIISNILGEMASSFSEIYFTLTVSLNAVDPSSDDFLNTQKMKHLLDLTSLEINESQFLVARESG